MHEGAYFWKIKKATEVGRLSRRREKEKLNPSCDSPPWTMVHARRSKKGFIFWFFVGSTFFNPLLNQKRFSYLKNAHPRKASLTESVELLEYIFCAGFFVDVTPPVEFICGMAQKTKCSVIGAEGCGGVEHNSIEVFGF